MILKLFTIVPQNIDMMESFKCRFRMQDAKTIFKK